MASRIYKAGTILTRNINANIYRPRPIIVFRTRCLLDAGVIKTRPLWLDVLEFIPPIRSPNHNSPPEPGIPPVIVFPNDSNINLEEVGRSRNKPITLFERHKKILAEPSRSGKNPSKGIEVGVPEEAGHKREGSELSTKRKKNVIRKMAVPDEDPNDELMKFLDSLDNEQKTNELNELK